MQITKWKSLRLLWAPWFLIHLYIYIEISFFIYSPDAIEVVRSLITSLVLCGCIFYSLGVRFLNRTFWQYLLAIGIIDELIGWFEKDGFDIVTTVVIFTFYFVLALYAFQNKTIWRLNQAPKT
ncbi:MAG: hypothetical protein CMK64_11620 [Pseudoalteromonas sp.]|nr:hypothetical protein [Pseudoalteromonas sp.]|tara:strand:+ start:1803 stop:2171 length:369 start_codon:yes stop_codon:yes gene_type:complete